MTIDLFGQRAFIIIYDGAGDAFKKGPVFGRQLVCRLDKDAALVVLAIAQLRRRHAENLFLEELSVAAVGLIPDDQVRGEAFQPPVGMRLYQLFDELDAFLFVYMQQNDGQVARSGLLLL